MTNSNLVGGFKAIAGEIGLLTDAMIHNKTFLGFVFGSFFAVLISAFLLTKNPKKIPVMLKYSEVESFQRLARRDKDGTYLTAYTNFIKTYTRVKMLFLFGVILIFAIVVVSLMSYTV